MDQGDGAEAGGSRNGPGQEHQGIVHSATDRSSAPLQAWSSQWSKVQHTLLHSLDLPADEKD